MEKNLASFLAFKQKCSLINHSKLFSMDYDDFRDHSLCTYVEFFEKLSTASFSENLAHVLI